jgi:hypothetical protein
VTLGLITFLCSVIGAWTAMHWYVFHNLSALGIDRNILIPLLWGLALTFPFTRLFTLKWRNPFLRTLYWIGAIWMGSIFMLSFWFLVSSGVRRLCRLAGMDSAADPTPWILATAAAVLAMIAWGLLNAVRGKSGMPSIVRRGTARGNARASSRFPTCIWD